MKTALLVLLACLSSTLFAQSQEDEDAYIEKYKQWAMREQINHGVPAAITLAQGIHESTCGLSMLATQANNHFGIKCKSTWKGATILHDDDAKQECFRKYANAEQSFVDHSLFLKDNNRYHFLFDIEVTDYKAWASGLKRAGYATNPLYVSKLVNIIERNNLQQYTYQAQNKKFETPKEIVPENDKVTTASVVTPPPPTTPTPVIAAPAEQPAVYYKGLKGFWAKKGDMLQQKALDYNIRYPRLLLLNDMYDEPVSRDQFIFIEKKRKVGTNEIHVVREGEDLAYIAQVEAVLLEYLYSYNNLKHGQEVAVGERLNLQYKSYDTPKLANQPAPTPTTQVANLPAVKPVEIIKTEPKTEIRIIEPEAQQPLVSKEENKAITKQISPEVKQETIIISEAKKDPVNIDDPTTIPRTIENTPIVKEERKNESPKVEIIYTDPVIDTPEVKKISSTENPISNGSPIIDEKKAKEVEAILSPGNKEVEALAIKAQKEKEEKERMDKELMDRLKRTDDYANSITKKMDEERKQIEARESEELKKRHELETQEKLRIEQEQQERDRIDAQKMQEEKEKQERNQSEIERQNQERLAQEESERNSIENEKAAKDLAERLRKDEEERAKRKYNEPGISDSVKNLKRKYDDVIYRTMPERKPVAVITPAKDSATVVVPKPIIKPTKPATTKPVIQAKNVSQAKSPKAKNVKEITKKKTATKKPLDKKVPAKKKNTKK